MKSYAALLGLLVATAALLAWPAKGQDLEKASFTGLSSSDYQAMFDTYVDIGYIPTQLRGYASAGQARYDVTFSPNERGKAFVARHGINTAVFTQENSSLRAKGYSLAIHSAFYVGNNLQHAAVWTKP